jgi:general secretion pathway protein F
VAPQALIVLSGFLRATGWYWFAAILAALAFALPIGAKRLRADAALPHSVAGRLVAAMIRPAASTLASLPPAAAARTVPLATSLWSLPRAAAAPRRGRREGVSLARALKEQKLFPPVLVHLVANGEASGQLAPMLERAAALLEQESARRITWFAALVQPALIVAMGAIVLVLVLAIMLPIVSMNQLIR